VSGNSAQESVGLIATVERIEERGFYAWRNRCHCGCSLQRIGEDVSEKGDYTPGVFHVEHHVRGEWVCRGFEKLIQALNGHDPYR
jgi:hypothetical protein